MIIDKYGMYMQHLESLIEDRSYSSLERAIFKGWHTKWTHAQVPLLVCLSIEVLSPAKLLSKTFQSEDVNTACTASLFEQSRQQLSRIGHKDYLELPTITRFLNKVKKGDDDYFQDVIIKYFGNAKDSVSQMKNEWVTVISEAVDARLKSDDTAPSKYGVSIIKTEGWPKREKDIEFCDEALICLLV